MKYSTWYLIGALTAFSLITFLKGCDQEHSGNLIVAPEGTQVQKVVLRIAQSPRPTAKAVRLKLEAAGIDDQGAVIGPVINPLVIHNPVFPCNLKLTLFRPPCRYQLTISTDLTRDPARSWQDVINICELQAGGIAIDVFEDFLVGKLSITAPKSVNAGAAAAVSCAASQINAPDRELYPLTLSLSEQGGRTFSSNAVQETASLSETFADPFALSSNATQRLFTCTLADGRSASQVAQKTVTRILPVSTETPVEPTAAPTETPVGPTPTPTVTPTGPTPTPTVTPTGPTPTPTVTPTGPTPTPTVTPTGPTPTPTPTSTPTLTPTPDPCQVQNANDSGTGSLRQVLTDAVTNGCSTITFTSGVTWITLSSTLPINFGPLTIDGGVGVTISGDNSTRVFLLGTGANVTFQNLSITEGSSTLGGGIANAGQLIITSGSNVYGNRSTNDNGGGIYNTGTLVVYGKVMGNTARWGGGIYNDGGTVTIHGVVSGNISMPTQGGGILHDNGILIINGSISGNTAATQGGGIYFRIGTISFESENLIQNNTANGGPGMGGGIYNNGGTFSGVLPEYGSGNSFENCAGAGGCP